jgi:endonuclease/exonuclease/phosphatase family metal-dependent hydrolase
MPFVRPSVFGPSTQSLPNVLRVATYNIHKGVRGVGLGKRLEIHNIGLGVEALDADLVFLQEVRLFHNRDASRFDQTLLGWPDEGQAEFLAPPGYHSAYCTNAFTRHGEHGNALLSRWRIGEHRHHDVSDHRFEQRGLLHVPVNWLGGTVNALVTHFGLIPVSRVRQAQRLVEYILAEIPADEPVVVAGDFNEWGERLDTILAECGLARARAPQGALGDNKTFPSRLPLLAIDRVYTRGFRCLSTQVPQGLAWSRMSDHLPLIAELEPA